MRNLVKYVGIGLLVMGLAACDNSDSKRNRWRSSGEQCQRPGNQPAGWQAELHPACPHGRPERQTGYPGRTICTSTLTLTGQKAVIVIVGDSTNEDLAVLAKRLEDQQRSRDPQLQVVSNKPLEIKRPYPAAAGQHHLRQGADRWSSVILGKVDDKLLTLQVTLPADNQQQAQTEAESIINTLTIQ